MDMLSLRDFLGLDYFAQNKGIVISTPDLCDYQKASLSLGDILTKQEDGWHNSLTFTDNSKKLQQTLQQSWHITDGDSAVDMLEWLLTEGNRRDYAPALEIWQQGAINEANSASPLQQGAMHLRDASQRLKQKGIINHDIEYQIGALGWDLGRCVALAKMCFTAEHISKIDAWHYISQSAKQSFRAFDGWNNFSCSYMLGFCLFWGTKDHRFDEAAEIREALITREDSPWKYNRWPDKDKR